MFTFQNITDLKKQFIPYISCLKDSRGMHSPPLCSRNMPPSIFNYQISWISEYRESITNFFVKKLKMHIPPVGFIHGCLKTPYV